MVEGPGYKLNGEKLKKRVIGQRVGSLGGVVVEKSKNQSTHQASAYNIFLGKKITDVKTLGKELFVFVEGESCLRVHFLMNGSLRFNNECMQPDAKGGTEMLKLILSSDCVYFYDISLDIRPAPECQQKYKELIDLDICSPTFDLQRAVKTIREHPGRLICDVILDQLVLPGVGNIIKNEALFNAGINPNTKVDELSEELVILLVKMNRDFTKIFYECRRDGKNLYKFMKVYKKKECHECGRKVVQCKVGEYERLTFYCPACQDNTMRLPTKNSLLGWVFLKQDVWSCGACTLENKPANRRCSVCLTPRPQPAATSRPHHLASAPLTGSKSTNRPHLTSTPTSGIKRQLEGEAQVSWNSKRSTLPRHPPTPQPSLTTQASHHGPLPATSQGSSQSRCVVCPGHRAAARRCKVVKEGHNKGRVFYTCNKPQGQQCKFFMWGDDHHPLCHHGKVTVLRTVLKLNANNGRDFYCCSHPKNKQCDFFQWVDTE